MTYTGSVFDMHVHSAPCLFDRLADDRSIHTLYRDAGFAGAVFKGHFESTVGRARAVGTAETRIYGGVVLNASVGGLQARVVDDAVRLGARIVWMPTIDSAEHSHRRLPVPAGRRRQRLAIPPADWTTEREVRQILRIAAEAQVVVATGHLSKAESAWLVEQGRAIGAPPVILTHPTYAVPAMTTSEVIELCSRGAIAEVTAYQVRHGDSPEELAMLARQLGPEFCVLTSDGGQPATPPPPAELMWLVEVLVDQGLDRSAALAMAGETPMRLLAIA